MSKKTGLLLATGLLLVGLFVAGCGASPEDFSPSEFDFDFGTMDNEDYVVHLADVDFVIVPEENYYILMEEGMTGENRVFYRRYIKYDGIENVVTETVNEFDLPRTFARSKNAKDWLKLRDPSRLDLLPKTYLNESVLVLWEQEDYDFGLEQQSLITLDRLKHMGALSRISEDFVISRKTTELEEIISNLENVYLPQHAHLAITRELEALPLSFAYQTTLSLHSLPLRERSAVVARVIIDLSYKVDEWGHPFELILETYFEATDENTSLALKEPVRDMATFGYVMRETLVEELNLYGVNPHNQSLQYANTTLNYEGDENDLRYIERYSMR
jgi:hypothetical protein